MDNVERRLWVEKVSREQLSATLAGEGALSFDIRTDSAPGHEGWLPVSHTFVVQQDGSGIFTVLFEREIKAMD